VVLLVPIALLLWNFLSGTPVADRTASTVAVSLGAYS